MTEPEIGCKALRRQWFRGCRKTSWYRSFDRSGLAPARQSKKERPPSNRTVSVVVPPRGNETATLPAIVATPVSWVPQNFLVSVVRS